MKPFLIALQFLTTIPIHLKVMPTKQQNAQSLLFYPVVGLWIGCILFACASLLATIPIVLSTTLIVVLWVWLTGGLHLDGLADTSDAWVGGFGDKERTLKIMKDPSCGPIGVLSLILLCAVKWSAIYVLLDLGQFNALILFPLLGRIAPLFLFLTTDYVRKNGLGSSIAEFIPRTLAIIVIIAGLLISGYFGVIGLCVSILMLITLLYLRYIFKQRIGGITGDTIGASIEIVEAVCLLSFAILLSYI